MWAFLPCSWHSWKMFNFSPLSILLALVFHRLLLSEWGNSFVFLVYWVFLFLSWKGIEVCECFFCVCWDDHVFLSFLLVIVFITLFDFHMLNQHWISSISPTYCDVQSFSYNTGFGLLVFHWGFGGQYSLLLLMSSFHVMSL